ncbi:hypothetical protein KC878_03530 [Candidatus Saccharibacteria bacterium]|nr:hypothetical protein [Candidatus Saccharibacteria bacterium]MCB9821399.1 hypothetical protein [Candidatus Nomurabacteria bacterium]
MNRTEKLIRYEEVVPENLRERTARRRALLNDAVEVDGRGDIGGQGTPNQVRGSRFGALIDIEGVFCDLEAVKARRRLVEILTCDSGKFPHVDDVAEDVRDLTWTNYRVEAQQTNQDRRVGLIKHFDNNSLVAWVDLPKKRRARKQLLDQDFGTSQIHFGLAYDSLDSGRKVFLPLLTSIKGGQEGACHIVAASEAVMDMASYSTRELAGLLYSVIDDLENLSIDQIIDLIEIISKILEKIPAQVGQQNLLAEALRRINSDPSGQDRVAKFKDLKLKQMLRVPTRRQVLRHVGQQASEVEVLDVVYRKEEALPNGSSVSVANYIVNEGVFMADNGICFCRMTVYKTIDPEQYGVERSQLRPWIHIDYSEIGGCEISALSENGYGYRDLDGEDSRLLEALNQIIRGKLMEIQTRKLRI